MPRTPGKSLALVLGLVFSTPALRADVTIRYKIEYKLADSLPPAMMGQVYEDELFFAKNGLDGYDSRRRSRDSRRDLPP
jgi:hypothetical protein